MVTVPQWVTRALVVLAGAGALVLLTLVVAGGPVDYVSAPTATQGPSWEAEPMTRTLVASGQSTRRGEGGELPGWVMALVQLILLAVAALLLYLLVLLAKIGFQALAERRREPDDVRHPVSVTPLPEVPERLVGEAARERRELLLGGEPRNAVVACWVDLEDSAAGSGLPRQRAETPTEYVARVLATWQVDEPAIADLAALYREARFSDHTMTEEHRARALVDLDRLHTDLAEAAGTP